MEPKHAVIVGAGVGGLATANLLAKAGYRVSVYEKAVQAGGRAGILESKGFRFDTGPSWYLMPEVFAHYYELLGESVDEQLTLTKLSPAYKVFFEHNEPVLITSNLDEDAKTFESIEDGAGDALRRYVESGERIYRLSLDHFLYTNFTSIKDFFNVSVLKNAPLMIRRAFQTIHRYVSTFVSDLRLKQILEYPMVFLGTSPFQAPAIYSLMSALDFKEGVFYPKGGMYTIIDSLVGIGKKLGVHYHYETSVDQIIVTDGIATGIRLAGGEIIPADIVISNADLHHTESVLIQEQYQSYPAAYWQKQKPGPSALLMYLGLNTTIPEFEHHNLLFVDAWQKNFENIYTDKVAPEKASIYICNPSKSDASVAPTGNENIFVLVPLPPSTDISEPELQKLSEQYLQQIKDMTGVNLGANVTTSTLYGPNDFKDTLHAWESSMLGPSHILKQSALFRTPNVSRKVKNLYYVGAGTTPGIGVPMCLISAELIYKRLAGEKQGGKAAEIKQIGII